MDLNNQGAGGCIPVEDVDSLTDDRSSSGTNFNFFTGSGNNGDNSITLTPTSAVNRVILSACAISSSAGGHSSTVEIEESTVVLASETVSVGRVAGVQVMHVETDVSAAAHTYDGISTGGSISLGIITGQVIIF